MKNKFKIQIASLTRYNVKLSGFTLLEMLFVLLLTSIVVSLAFAYFTTFQKYLQNQNRVNSYEMEVQRFESLLYYDLDGASTLEFKGGLLVCKGTNVKYEFNERYVIRFQNTETDSLHGKHIDYLVHYLNKKSDVIVGLELEIIDINNRQRVYAFNRFNDEKTKFEDFIKKQ